MFQYHAPTPAVAPEQWHQRAVALLASFLAIVIVAPWVIWMPTLLLAGVAMVAVARSDVRLDLLANDPVTTPVTAPATIPVTRPVNSPSRTFAVVSMLALVSAVIPYLTNDVTVAGITRLAQFSILPLAAAAFACRPRPRDVTLALWAGCAAGAVFSGVSAVVQVVVLDVPRAEGPGRNAIVFGDVALTLGAVALALGPVVTARAGDATPPALTARRMRTATIVAATCGGVGSLLSGSRGSWIAVPAIAAILLWQLRHVRPRAAVTWTLGAFAGIAALVIASGGMPVRRAIDTFGNIVDYIGAGPYDAGSGTTIGARFEAWKAALTTFVQEPVLGVGWGNLRAEFREEALHGRRNLRILQFDHAHQQVLGTLASSGVIGLLAWSAVVVVPGVYFARGARAESESTRWTATAGLVVVAAYTVYGLTESIFESIIALAVYAVSVAALLSQLDPVDLARPAQGRRARRRQEDRAVSVS